MKLTFNGVRDCIIGNFHVHILCIVQNLRDVRRRRDTCTWRNSQLTTCVRWFILNWICGYFQFRSNSICHRSETILISYCLNKERTREGEHPLGRSRHESSVRQHPTVELGRLKKNHLGRFCQLTLHLSARRLSPWRGWQSPSTTAAGRPPSF